MLKCKNKFTILIITLFVVFPSQVLSQKNNNADPIDSAFLNLSLNNDKHEMKSTTSSSERIYFETIVSPIAGGVVAISSSFISLAIAEGVGYSDRYPWGYAAISGLLGHTIGSAFSVYFFEKNGFNDINFGNTLIASLIGTALGVGVLEISGGDLWNNEIGIISLITFPTIASVIYANLIAPKKFPEKISYITLLKKTLIKNSISHKDYYNSSKIFELEFMRVDF